MSVRPQDDNRVIMFNDGTHENMPIPTAVDITKMKPEQLEDVGNILAYALNHGSGAAVRLAFPFAYLIAQLGASGEKDLEKRVRQFEQEGENARWGTVTVKW